MKNYFFPALPLFIPFGAHKNRASLMKLFSKRLFGKNNNFLYGYEGSIDQKATLGFTKIREPKRCLFVHPTP
jgi:hypothetical protein